MSENPAIIRDILRKEWRSDAMIMSDWYVMPCFRRGSLS